MPCQLHCPTVILPLEIVVRLAQHRRFTSHVCNKTLGNLHICIFEIVGRITIPPSDITLCYSFCIMVKRTVVPTAIELVCKGLWQGKFVCNLFHVIATVEHVYHLIVEEEVHVSLLFHQLKALVVGIALSCYIPCGPMMCADNNFGVWEASNSIIYRLCHSFGVTHFCTARRKQIVHRLRDVFTRTQCAIIFYINMHFRRCFCPWVILENEVQTINGHPHIFLSCSLLYFNRGNGN